MGLDPRGDSGLFAAGKPTDNAFIESFNSRVRQECLNQSWFLSLEDDQEKIEAWRLDYNHVRPHSAIGDVPGSNFSRKTGISHLIWSNLRGALKSTED